MGEKLVFWGAYAGTAYLILDPLAPNCAATIGELAVGAVHSYSCSVESVTADFTNVATATGYYGDTQTYSTDWTLTQRDRDTDSSLGFRNSITSATSSRTRRTAGTA